jgi:peptide/nickel transport system substrate-binding protein
MTVAQKLWRLRGLAILVILAMVLAACGAPAGAPAAEAPAGESAAPAEGEEAAAPATGRGAGGTVNVIYWQAPSILNPYLSGGTKDIEASSVVLEPLAHYDPDGVMIPYLAAEIPTVENGGISEDLTSITWKLKEGVLWSDGTPFTADDVVFSYEYCEDPEMGCNPISNLDDVESIEAVDDLTVKITFGKPKPFPYGPFVGGSIPIVQKAQFQDCMGAKAQECTEQNFGPIGTGAYKVKEFRANDTVLFEINENYRDPEKPYFSEVVIKGGGDAAAAARSVLETGEADYAWNLQIEPQILSQMEAAGLGTVIPAFGPGVERLIVNFTNPDPALGDKRSEWTPEDPNPHPFLTDYNVRKALSMAIDRAAINEIGYGPGGQPGCNIVPAPAYQASTANDDCLVQDIEGAKALLEESGWVDENGDGVREKDGIRLSILYQTSTNSVRQKTQALIKQWWEEIGVETELRNVSADVFFGGDPASPDTYGKFYADIEMFTNTWDGTDAESYMGNWLCSEIARAENQWLGNNIPRWCSDEYAPQYEALLAELSATVGTEARGEIVKQLNDLIVQDYAMIPLIWRADVSARANTLGGIEKNNAWDAELWNIADWYRTE